MKGAIQVIRKPIPTSIWHINFLTAETTKSIKGRLWNSRDLIKKQGFGIYIDEERGDFTFIETREH